MDNNFVKIEGGTFLMGSARDEPGRKSDEVPHQVTVSTFYMAKYEVTQQEYFDIMSAEPSIFSGPTRPVEMVNWYDAISYCNKRSAREGLTRPYILNGDATSWNHSATGYRLPTEAEWEYACKANTTTPFYNGYRLGKENANFNRLKRATTPVGSYLANPWGLYDMYGNVWEWCWDYYGAYTLVSQQDPTGVEQSGNRCWRGGSWGSTSQVMRSAFRGYSLPVLRFNYLGFRVCLPACP
jgi:formylglycine-generating enzyme required for sulfatase activity